MGPSGKGGRSDGRRVRVSVMGSRGAWFTSAGAPGGRDPPTHPPPNVWRSPNRCGDETSQLVARIPSHDRDHAVVPADRVKAEGKGRHPQSGGREPAAPEITHDDADTRDAVELSEHRGRCGI